MRVTGTLQDIVLTNGDTHVVGRGDFEDADTRISRTQFTLKCDGGASVMVTCHGPNHCVVIRGNGDRTVLHSGEQTLELFPNDSIYPFPDSKASLCVSTAKRARVEEPIVTADAIEAALAPHRDDIIFLSLDSHAGCHRVTLLHNGDQLVLQQQQLTHQWTCERGGPLRDPINRALFKLSVDDGVSFADVLRTIVPLLRVSSVVLSQFSSDAQSFGSRDA
jgi:hypothetical protein